MSNSVEDANFILPYPPKGLCPNCRMQLRTTSIERLINKTKLRGEKRKLIKAGIVVR
jgi:hypothetical protein